MPINKSMAVTLENMTPAHGEISAHICLRCNGIIAFSRCKLNNKLYKLDRH